MDADRPPEPDRLGAGAHEEALVQLMVTLDHVMVAVASMEAASESLRSAGFTVMPGGRHDALPTENALGCFEDGSYLELIAACEPGDRVEWRELARDAAAWERHLHGVSAIARRFLPTLAGPDGVADWCVLGSGLAGTAARLRSLGLPAAGPVPMRRERRDGERLEWELLLPGSHLLPFWIRDRTARERRVPSSPDAVRHANGASGISAVRVRVPNVGLGALALGDVLDAIPRARADGTAVLELGSWRVELVAGEPEGAFAAAIAGCGPLPGDVRALGLEPARAG